MYSPACKNCHYSVVIEGDTDGYLECHRHSIQAVGIDDEGAIVSAFPVTEPELWCGDFEEYINIDIFQVADLGKRTESDFNGRSRSNLSTNSWF